MIAEGTELAPLNYRRVQPEGLYSAVGYEIWPRAMYDILRYVNDNYAPKAIYISENGVATRPETVGSDGHVWDELRAAYYVDHLAEVVEPYFAAAGDDDLHGRATAARRDRQPPLRLSPLPSPPSTR